ncbi:FMN-binding protein [Thiocapsa imhoffii]|uniref:Ion-translocating oxidoreductase complex subunit G n=1 Tax=Thiocapsa imhoffii TaxID=382777 RepID=A0A9X1B9I6_9GAMM|nr:FMN-binding protein [Thiocapsa imhoffii]MBK1645994.1 FMN-binding protein [Thiocapsa imhoffii]
MSVDVETHSQPQREPSTPLPVTPSWAMLRTLAGIATLSGLLVVMVYQFTQPIIAENERVLTERAVFEVLPGASSNVIFILDEHGISQVGEGRSGVRIFAGYRPDGSLRGIAFPAAARGYQDVIQFLFGYDPACACIIGSKVLRSTETPGLGDKIDNDPRFLANFDALDARLDPDGRALLNPITLVAQGTKTDPWQIDGISGSTISAQAMARALNEAAQRFLPIIQREQATLTQPTP